VIDYLMTLATGFSVVAAVLLLCVYAFLYRLWNKPWRSIAAAAVLLLSFAALQTMHWYSVNTPGQLYDSKWYSSIILLTAPAFYFFVRDYILAEPENILFLCQGLHSGRARKTFAHSLTRCAIVA